jgi:hypothetical protein
MVKVILVTNDNKVQLVELKLYNDFSEIAHEYTPEAVAKYNLENKLDKNSERKPICPGQLESMREPGSRNFSIINEKFNCCMGTSDEGKYSTKPDEYFVFQDFLPDRGFNMISTALCNFRTGRKTPKYGNLVIYKRHFGQLVDMSIEDFETYFMHHLNNHQSLFTLKKVDPDSDSDQECNSTDTAQDKDILTSGPSVCVIS